MLKLKMLVILLVLSSVALAADPPKTKSKPTDFNKVYDSLLHRAKKLDSTVDFVELRVTFTKTTHYNPYGNPGHWRDSMYLARQRDDAKAITKYARAVLDSNYMDIDAHTLAGYAANQTGDSTEFALHRWFAKHLVKSLFDSGTGKTPEFAYYLISIDEQQTMLALMGVQVMGRTMVDVDGQQYSKVDISDPQRNGKRSTVYFNLTLPMVWLKENSKLPKAG
jgi:hypothetical protein